MAVRSTPLQVRGLNNKYMLGKTEIKGEDIDLAQEVAQPVEIIDAEDAGPARDQGATRQAPIEGQFSLM